MITFYCDQCGARVNYEKSEAGFILLHYHFIPCSNCHHPMIADIEEENDENLILNSINQEETEYIKKSIKQYGHLKVWLTLEENPDPKTRIAERRCFIQAGGQIPKKGVKI